jgi:1,4-alpha-glucan branching enzyme
MAERSVGDLAVVLHSHMPYVEGFGTYPFGEEWLFDAVIRSYLPLLEIAEGITLSVTPVLADQLEAPGVSERLRRFLVEHRLGAAEAEVRDSPPERSRAAAAETARYRHALGLFDAVGGDLVGALSEAGHAGRVALIASAATHPVLPLLATRAGQRLQVDAGLRSHRRRFGPTRGFWLPECAYEPGLEWLLGEHGISWFCTDQSAHEPAMDALAPIRLGAEQVAFTIDWEAVSWLWALDGYPSDPAHAEFHRKSMRGMRLWSIAGQPYDPEGAWEVATRQAGEFARAAAERLQLYAVERSRRGLLVFAIDTELLGHWWSEGVIWLSELLRIAPDHGLRLLTLPQALFEHEPEPRRVAASTWGEGKDRRTWEGPAVADLAWGARRLELRLLRALGEGLTREAALRAARELLAVQASDWAFLDARGQAGDYPFQRATGHARALLEAIDSAAPDPRMRALAPDLSLAPLLQP